MNIFREKIFYYSKLTSCLILRVYFYYYFKFINFFGATSIENIISSPLKHYYCYILNARRAVCYHLISACPHSTGCWYNSRVFFIIIRYLYCIMIIFLITKSSAMKITAIIRVNKSSNRSLALNYR